MAADQPSTLRTIDGFSSLSVSTNSSAAFRASSRSSSCWGRTAALPFPTPEGGKSKLKADPPAERLADGWRWAGVDLGLRQEKS
jgi:hypothetical protein